MKTEKKPPAKTGPRPAPPPVPDVDVPEPDPDDLPPSRA